MLHYIESLAEVAEVHIDNYGLITILQILSPIIE